jgi:hypothetical protein
MYEGRQCTQAAKMKRGPFRPYRNHSQMFKATTVGAALVCFVLIAVEVWDLLRNSNALVASIVLIFVAGGILNTWSALTEDQRRGP